MVSNHMALEYSVFSSITIPARISTAPTYQRLLRYCELPAINRPAVTPTTTDTRTNCITRTVSTTVTSINTPPTTIAPHCQSEGTTMGTAGKKTGKPMLQRKSSSWEMVQGLDSFSLKTSELTQPRRSPGRNSQSLVREQLSSMRREPRMMQPKQSPQIVMRCPRVTSQNMAKRSPPDPFHPQYRLSIKPRKDMKQTALSRLSSPGSGRQGYSSYFRMIPRQFIRKAHRQATKAYCSIGIPSHPARKVWLSTSKGVRITNDRLLSRMVGSWLVSLYEQSSLSGSACGVVPGLWSSSFSSSLFWSCLLDIEYKVDGETGERSWVLCCFLGIRNNWH